VLNKEIPFLRIGLPLCIGILGGRYFRPDTGLLLILAVSAVFGFIISLFFNKGQTNLVYGYSLNTALLVSGALLYSIEKSNLSTLSPVTADFLGTVSEYPEEKEKIYRIILKLRCRMTAAKTERLNGSLLINMKKSPASGSLLPGDMVKIRCKPVEISNRGNPCEFDYKFYMENHGIRYTAFTAEKDILYNIHPRHRKLVHRALIIRERIISMYEQRGIKGERLALIAAITLGQKNLLEPGQKQDFIKAGIMHIMAVSGLHAVILSMLIFSLLFFLKGKLNFLRIIITVLFLWLFAFITGLTPSVLRAAIMFTFIQAGKIMNRNVNNINSVLASAVVLLTVRPSVVFDAGFLLSYAAVLFILSFYNHLYSVFNFKNWLVDKIWQSAAVTLVAQLGTLSLTISLFNRFPTYFMITNIIIVPLSSLLIIIGCLIPLIFPLKFISQPVASILDLLTGLTGELTEKAASLPFSSIDNIGMGAAESVLLVVFIFLFLKHLINHQLIPLRYPLFILIILTTTVTIRDIYERNSNELIVYNSTGLYTVGIRNGKHLDLFTDNLKLSPEVLRHCAARNLRVKLHCRKSDITALNAGGYRILISRKLNNEILRQKGPDFIILYGKDQVTEKNIRSGRHIRSVILTGKAPPDTEFQGNIAADSLHYIKKSGAYRLKF
jgi:competence protein ComEC